MNHSLYNETGINERMLENVYAMRHHQCSGRPHRCMVCRKIGPIHPGKYHEDSVPHNDEENTKYGKQSLSLRKESLNIPCLKGQFENLSSRSEYASNHLSTVLMNSACETSVRDFLRTVRSVLLKNVLKEASIRRVIGKCNSSGQLFCRQSTNSALSMILDTPSRVAISAYF